jgi:ubiquinone/menaquinone biosynthesis C-methylase UbiE
VASSKEKRDKRFPLYAHDNPFRRLLAPPRRLIQPYITEGQVAADLGCGPGYYTLALAEAVGPKGKVYAVDSDGKAAHAVMQKAVRRGFRNIEARAQSASALAFIENGSVDFVLAHGLLCSMAPSFHEAALDEIRRILKPTGRAFLSAAKGPWSYVGRAEWERILEGFKVERRGGGFPVIANKWALVSVANRPS